MTLYSPQGSLSSLLNGTGILSTSYYNNRFQPCRIAINGSGSAPGSCGDGTNKGNVLDYSYNFNFGVTDNGNVIGITNNLTKNTPGDRSQTFTYDVLNRIATAGTVSTTTANCWGEQYSYDAWGNLLSITGITPQYNGCMQESGFSLNVNAKNQILGFCYDADGNFLAPSPSPCTPIYTFNAENQMISTAGINYIYDGDGKRVEKSNSKLYWYGASAVPLDETDASGNLIDEYIFFGGKRIARRDSSGNVNYYFADHLGTARVVTNATGTVPTLDDSDFYPFGGQRPLLFSSGNTYKFTGKERDAESGNDNFGARYFASSWGRFLSPDPSNAGARTIDPQSWNGYAYVGNNPLRFTDSTGMGTDPSDDTWFHPLRWPGGQDPLWNSNSSSSRNSSGYCQASASSCGASGNSPMLDAAMGSSPFGFQYIDHNGVAYPGLFDTWADYASWSTYIAAVSGYEDDKIRGVGPQLAYVVAGLIKQGATETEIGNFLKANNDPLATALGGGNCDFKDTGFAFKCDNDRCSNGLDFSHHDGTFHRDTANPYSLPSGTLQHFGVDLIWGNIVDVIPR